MTINCKLQRHYNHKACGVNGGPNFEFSEGSRAGKIFANWL